MQGFPADDFHLLRGQQYQNTSLLNDPIHAWITHAINFADKIFTEIELPSGFRKLLSEMGNELILRFGVTTKFLREEFWPSSVLHMSQQQQFSCSVRTEIITIITTVVMHQGNAYPLHQAAFQISACSLVKQGSGRHERREAQYQGHKSSQRLLFSYTSQNVDSPDRKTLDQDSADTNTD